MTGITRNRATKNSDKVVGRDGSNSTTSQFCAVILAFKTFISEVSPAGRLNPCHSGSGATGNMEMFLGLGNKKA